METVRLLLIEDDQAYAHLLQIRLQQSIERRFEVVHVTSLDKTFQQLEQSAFDIALVDLSLPDSKGLNTFRAITSRAPLLPVILLTGNTDESIALQVLKEGAEDYIIKGEVHERYLLRAIHYAIERKALQINLQEKNRQLEELVRTDTLTGLFSRRYGLAYLEEEMARYHRYTTLFSVIHIDIDDFKHINDTYGHEAGDIALRAVADYIHTSKRPFDKAVRYGGDEFLLILPETDLDGVESVCQRLQAAPIFCQLREDVSQQISLSIGAACVLNVSNSTELIDAADLAMLIAKRQGTGRYHIYQGAFGEQEPTDALKLLHQTRGSIREAFCRILHLVLAEVEREGDLIESHRELMLDLSEELSQKLNLSHDEWRTLRNAIHLTTFGKLNLCWEIASKPTMLTIQQQQVLQQTIQRNINLLRQTQYLSSEADALSFMYEWFDGSGFHKLASDDIPILSRILGLLWAYALLYIGGPHTAPHTREKAWNCILEETKTHFDPVIVSHLADVLEEYYADSHDRASGHFLLIEDEQSTSTLLRQRLSRVGYHVTVASNLHEASAHIVHQQWVSILTDITLPDGNGLYFTAETLRDREHPPILFVMASSAEQETIEAARELGASAYCVKPVRFRKLLKVLAQCRNSSETIPFQVIAEESHT